MKDIAVLMKDIAVPISVRGATGAHTVVGVGHRYVRGARPDGQLIGVPRPVRRHGIVVPCGSPG
jgi:hypothetical protein